MAPPQNSPTAALPGPASARDGRCDELDASAAGLTRTELRERLVRDKGSIRELARRYAVNPKTVVRWRRDARAGSQPTKRRRALSIDEEVMVVAARISMLLPLDDCLYLLRTKIPHLTRSTLHRCYQRHGVSCLQPSGERALWTRGARNGRLGAFVLSHSPMRCTNGDFVIVSAADIYSKVTRSRTYPSISRQQVGEFIQDLLEATPYKVSSILIGDSKLASAFFDGGWLEAFSAQFPQLRFDRWTAETPQGPADASHADAIDILVEDDFVRSNSTIEDVVSYLAAAQVDFYNHVRLKSLKGMTPRKYVHSVWLQHPELFVRPPD